MKNKVYKRSIIHAALNRAKLRQRLGLTRPERTVPPLVHLMIDDIRAEKQKELAS